MTVTFLSPRSHAAVLLCGAALLALTACGDPDLRRYGKLGFDTSNAAQKATLHRPTPDSRGIISYPSYQVAVAQRGDTVATVAGRIGMDAGELASFNAVSPATTLNKGEVLALPRRVAEPVTDAAGAAAAAGASQVDIHALASSALDRAAAAQTAAPTASATAAAPTTTAAVQPASAQPARHKVKRGETAFTIARSYNVSPKALAEWNGLSSDMSVREGQYLLIPPTASAAQGDAALSATTAPGQGSPTPEPPSASQPLPSDNPPVASAPVDTSSVPNLGASRSASSSQLLMPVPGSIVRPYVKKKNDGIDISAAAGTAVKAADAGTVAAITKDTEQVPIIVIRHANGLLTVYANVDAITVSKGDSVKRGQTIAKVRSGSDAYLHFEVRKGFDSVDPVPYLQ